MSWASDEGFRDRVALVTGARGAIGSAVTHALAQCGATVVAADIEEREPLADARLGDGKIHRVRLDVSRKPEVDALTARIRKDLGRIDVLVNVAGIVSMGSAAGLAEGEWDRVMAVNLKGTFLCCQAVMSVMRENTYGRIINIGSVVGKNGGNARPWLSPEEQQKSGNVAYGVSKAGVHAMTAFLARELAAHGITVNAVAPGPVASAMTAHFPEHLHALVPAGRMGTPDDVARAVLFLASAAAGFVTGEVLDVNGGIWCD